jgi:hypothetical protein
VYAFVSPGKLGSTTLVAAVPLDGDANADPYQVYADNAHFYWK